MSGSSFKTCDSGHFYPSSNDSCPYCNKQKNNPNMDSSGDKTEVIDNNSGDDKTAIISPTTNMGNKTSTPNFDNPDKTVIFSPKKGDKTPKQSNIRKLVGWIVSYTLNENGMDFRLYEGKNTVGRGMDCNIRITEDKLLSSEHATFLYRGDSIYIRDEMASNPSFINEEELMPGATVKLKDGDIIMIGENQYLLRMTKM
jgi:hypothetical protein